MQAQCLLKDYFYHLCSNFFKFGFMALETGLEPVTL